MSSKVDARRIGKNQSYDSVVLHQRVALSTIAQFAMDLMKVATIQAAFSDFKDNNGRYQRRLLTEQEVVGRCMKIAILAFEEFENEGWSEEVESFASLMHDDGAAMGFNQKE